MSTEFRRGGTLHGGAVPCAGLLLLLGLAAALSGCGTGGPVEVQKQRLLQSVKKNPADTRAWVNLGVSHRRLKEYHRAVAAFRKALKIDPQNADARYGLGLCYHHMGKYDKAIKQYRELRLIDPDLADRLFKVLNTS